MSGPSGWTDDDKSDWAQEQAAKHPDRVEETISGDEFLIDGGGRFQLLPSEDPMYGDPQWEMLELRDGGDPDNQDDWGITETFSDIDDALVYVNGKSSPAQQAQPQVQPQAPQTDPAQIAQLQERIYDLKSKGMNILPDEALELKRLEQQFSSMKGTRLAQSIWEIIMPKLMEEQNRITDREATLLFTMWQNSPPGSRFFALPSGADSRTAMTLKTRGLVAGFGDQLELTDKGRKVLIEMCTNEPNRFEKKATNVSYNSIKQKTARPRQTHVKRASRAPGAFNLREQSIKRMRGE